MGESSSSIMSKTYSSNFETKYNMRRESRVVKLEKIDNVSKMLKSFTPIKAVENMSLGDTLR